MLTAIVLLLILTSVIALLRAIAHDGYGTRPAPRSHPDDPFGLTHHLR